MATTYESVSDLAEAIRRAEEAHGKHEERTGEADPDWPDWYPKPTLPPTQEAPASEATVPD